MNAAKVAWRVRSKALVGRSVTFLGARSVQLVDGVMPTSDRADQAGIVDQEG